MAANTTNVAARNVASPVRNSSPAGFAMMKQNQSTNAILSLTIRSTDTKSRKSDAKIARLSNHRSQIVHHVGLNSLNISVQFAIFSITRATKSKFFIVNNVASVEWVEGIISFIVTFANAAFQMCKKGTILVCEGS